MVNEEIKPKPKRAYKKIGDVFCVEFGNGFKGYFQYVAKDSEQLYSEVIRAFYTHYPVDYEPKIEDIVKDKVVFYAHTFISFGIWDNIWYKVGKSTNLGLEELEKVLFGTVCNYTHRTDDGQYIKREIVNGKYVDTIVNPLDNWRIWKVNQVPLWNYKLPEEFYNVVEEGTAFNYSQIVNRMKLGYYTNTDPAFRALKRHPRPEVDSFMVKEYPEEKHYYHFKGEFCEQEVIITGNSIIRLTHKKPICVSHKLYTQPFGSIEWLNQDFITADEFEAAWNSPKSEQKKLSGK